METIKRRNAKTGRLQAQLVVLLALASMWTTVEAAETSATSCTQCPICCITGTGDDGAPTYTCSDNELTCKLKPKTDFSVLLTTLLIILGFAFGNALVTKAFRSSSSSSTSSSSGGPAAPR